MEVTLAVLADYANVSQDGKLNIMGIFQDVNPPVLPFLLSQMYLVVAFEAGPAEFGSQKHIRIVLLDNDGSEILRLEGEAEVPRPARPGRRAYINQVIGLQGITFERAGGYAFVILVSGEQKTTVSLHVNDPNTQGEP